MFHPVKTKILVYGDTKSQPDRKWYLGESYVDEVESHTHCGVLLHTSKSSVHHTKMVCRKGRGKMLSVLNSGLYNLNPITSCKLYKSIVQPSALFGCELWSSLNITEDLMLERFQRFCAKTIQHLGRRARSDICVTMLGLSSVKGYINYMTLSFFRRLMALPDTCISKQIFVRRWLQSKVEMFHRSNFCSNLHSVLSKYSILDYAENFMFEEGFIPDKIVWKNICKRHILEYEDKCFKERTSSPDFDFFSGIQSSTCHFNNLWYIAKIHRNKLDKCFQIAKWIAEPYTDIEILCEHCGRMFSNGLVHKVLTCDHNANNVQNFWEILTNEFPLDLSVFLNNIDEFHQLQVMLGAFLDYEEACNKFYTLCIDFIATSLKE